MGLYSMLSIAQFAYLFFVDLYLLSVFFFQICDGVNTVSVLRVTAAEAIAGSTVCQDARKNNILENH